MIETVLNKAINKSTSLMMWCQRLFSHSFILAFIGKVTTINQTEKNFFKQNCETVSYCYDHSIDDLKWKYKEIFSDFNNSWHLIMKCVFWSIFTSFGYGKAKQRPTVFFASLAIFFSCRNEKIEITNNKNLYLLTYPYIFFKKMLCV